MDEHPFPVACGGQTDSLPEAEEQALLDGVRRGDEQSYELIVQQYGGMMLGVARRLLRDEEDARDVVQEAFLCAFRALSRFRQDAKLSTWLYRIAVNAALMKIRAASRRPEVSIDHLLPTFDEQGRRVEPVVPSPVTTEEVILRQETRAYVRSCIDRLPPSHRTVLILRDLEELDTAEVARALGITENAVKIRLHRARQALMTLLRAS